MTGRELECKIQTPGQEHDIRQVAFRDELMKPADLAVASLLEVCEAVANAGYEVYTVTDGGATIWLTKHDNIATIDSMLTVIEN